MYFGMPGDGGGLAGFAEENEVVDDASPGVVLDGVVVVELDGISVCGIVGGMGEDEVVCRLLLLTADELGVGSRG